MAGARRPDPHVFATETTATGGALSGEARVAFECLKNVGLGGGKEIKKSTCFGRVVAQKHEGVLVVTISPYDGGMRTVVDGGPALTLHAVHSKGVGVNEVLKWFA